MALIDVVKYDGNDQEFCWKFPSENLRLGTQLVVKPAQTAFFVKGGKILDQFEPGTTTISSNNIPLLTTLTSLPFGGNTPFQAEVWYINLISKLDNKWGTGTPIQVEDMEYGVVVPVRACGQFGFKIGNPKLFLEALVGTIKIFSADKIVEYLEGKLLSTITTRIMKKIVLEKISVLQINIFLEDLSKYCEEGIKDEYARFGLDIVNFYIMSISVPEDDSSVIKLKEAKELAMRVKTIGKDIYQMDRGFDVMETAAGNEGTLGGLLGAGMGLGMGVGMGNIMGNQMSIIGNQTNSQLPPPPPLMLQFYILVNNVQQGPYPIQQLQILVDQGTLTRNTMVWKPGMVNWETAGNQSELMGLFSPPPPPK